MTKIEKRGDKNRAMGWLFLLHGGKKYHTIHIRMRKITTAILLIIATTGNVFARVKGSDCDEGRDNANDCREIAGCYWNEKTAECDVCPPNMFCVGRRDKVTKYASCDPDVYTEIEEDDPIYIKSPSTYITLIQADYTLSTQHWGAVGPQECAVQVTCGPGTGLVWDGTVNDKIRCEDCMYKNTVDTGDENKWFSVREYIKNIDDFDGKEFDYEGCDSCGTNSHLISVTEGCECNTGYHVFDKANTSIDNDHADCIADAYPVYIYADCDVLGTDPINVGNIKYVTHNINSWYITNNFGTYDSNKDNVFGTIGGALEASKPQLSKTGYHLIGDGNSIYEMGDNWYIDTTTKADVSNISRFDHDDNILTDDELNAAIGIQGQNTKYLVCPHWTANTFTIQYDAGKYDTSTTAKFKANISSTTCTYGDECTIYGENPSAENTAYVFTGWKITGIKSANSDNSGQITVGDVTIKNDDIIQPGARIDNAATDNGGVITLTAQWQQCPAGYYGCTTVDTGEVYACKCPAGSTSEPGATDIKGCFITKETKFCTGDNCFTLNISNTIRTTGSDCTDKVKVPDTTN